MKLFLATLVIALNVTGAMAQECQMPWYNYTTEENDCWEGIPPNRELVNYLPKKPAAQGLYATYLAQGKSHIEAFELTLKAIIGEIGEKK